MKAKELMRAGLVVLAMGVAAVFAHAQDAPKPAVERGACQRAYYSAAEAIDEVYDKLPGVDPAVMLSDSMSLGDAGWLAGSADPRVSEPLCGADRVQRLEQIAAELRRVKARLDVDSKAAGIDRVRTGAAKALDDLAGWVGTRK
jgi:hypothetical protein